MANKEITGTFDAKSEQAKAIKRRLMDGIARSNIYPNGININDLKGRLEADSGFDINYATLQKALNEDDPNLNTLCIIAICRYFHLDTAYVLSEPENNANISDFTDQCPSEKFAVLEDKLYFGKYFGYLYSAKPSKNQINKFTLDIGPVDADAHKITAKLDITFAYTTTDGNTDVKHCLMSGVPIHAKKQNSIITLFTDDMGTYYIFTFSYVSYKTRSLFYRRGAVITQGRDAIRSPMMQSFVLFSEDIPKENLKFIPGLLLMNNNSFHISEKALNELAESDPTVAKLCNEFNYLICHNTETVCTINESQILADTNTAMSRNEILTALQLLKARSSDSTRIYFPESDIYSEFSKYIHKDFLSQSVQTRTSLKGLF